MNGEEDLAAVFLRCAGFQVLARNHRNYGAEIDLLCRLDSGQDYFIFEIKRARSGTNALYPLISARQRERLANAAKGLLHNSGSYRTVRLYLLMVDVAQRAVSPVPMDY